MQAMNGRAQVDSQRGLLAQQQGLRLEGTTFVFALRYCVLEAIEAVIRSLLSRSMMT